MLKSGPGERDVQLDTGRIMPEEQDHALAYEGLCIVDTRNDALLGEPAEKRGHIGAIALDDCINVSGHPTNTARDDRNSTDHHPRNLRPLQSAYEGRERLLDSQLTSAGLALHDVALAPSGASLVEFLAR
jgi:hypothetical protein